MIFRVQVKLENVFSTPLQLRRAHLLWRFTPAGSEESVTNGGGEDAAASCVDTALVDTVVLEPASTTEITFQVRLTVELSTMVREYLQFLEKAWLYQIAYQFNELCGQTYQYHDTFRI